MQALSEITASDIMDRAPAHLRGLTFEKPAPQKQPEIVTLNQLDTSQPKVAQAVEYARKWQARRADSPEASYLLASKGKGVGKTHILKSILWSQQIIPLGVNGIIAPANRFYMADDLIGLAFGRQGANVRSLIPSTDNFVCIDDIGTESKPEFCAKDSWPRERQVTWFKVVNHCYENRIGIIATTNLKIGPDFEEWIGSRAFSRLMEMAPKGYMRDLTGVPDWRKMASGR